MKELEVVDEWSEKKIRHLKDYTYYSGRHRTYSKIDLIFTTVGILADVSSVYIGKRIYSDHAPIIMERGCRDKKTQTM